MNVLDAAYLTVRDYPGGAPALAPRMGKNATTLSHEVNPPAGSKAKFGLVDAVTAIKMSDNWAIVNAMMAEIGGIAFRLPHASEPDSEAGQRMALVAQDFALLMAEVAASTADGVIKPNEYARIAKAWSELVSEGQRMLAYFEHQVPEGAKRGRRG